MVSRYSALPLHRVGIVQRFDDLKFARVRRGIVYFLAAWSGASVMLFRHVTEALARLDSTVLEFIVVDLDCVPADFWAEAFDRLTPAGAGETLWVRDGVVVASALTSPRPGADSEFMRYTRILIDEETKSG
ncbi:MAG TPA: hypothetical protein PK156_34840 [Polyangium sp.]|nr:hypothetical protein [Polyangium sp.]